MSLLRMAALTRVAEHFPSGRHGAGELLEEVE
jgi:hypothetical protein